MPPQTCVLILGATSAVAHEVARIYAQRGARLHLVGRNPDKLERVAASCAGALVTTEQADFDDVQAAPALVQRCIEALGHVDVVLIAHGLLGDQLASERSYDVAAATLHTNLSSVVALLVPLANHLEQARSGQIAVITSVAGERGRPRNFTYGAAKGALNLYLQGLRSRLYASGVCVTTLKLGPVDTPMTHDHPKNAVFVSRERAARGIVRAMDKRLQEAFVPWYWALIMPVVRNTPEALFQRLKFLSGR